jgi:hypothetical protein
LDTNKKVKLGLLDKPEFWQYLASLPTHSLRILASVDWDTDKAKIIISKQTGEQPPQVQVVSEE